MTTAQCGTYAAYIRHRRNRETPCLPCVDARSDYARSYRIRTGRVATVAVTPHVLGLLLLSDPDALRQAVAELGQRTVDAAKDMSARDTKAVAS